MGFNWDSAAVEQLTTLAASVKSVREIANALGVTRNMVIGKASRMGIQLPVGRSGPPVGAKFKPRIRTGTGLSFRSKFPTTPQTVVASDAPVSLDIPFGELKRRHCRFPVTDDAPHFFCGNPQAEGSSYCPYHHGVCRHVR